MSSLKKNKIIIVLVGLLLVGFGTYQYIMQPPKSTASKKADYTETAINFIEEVRKNPNKWTGKVVVLEGNVTSKDGLGVKLNEKIYCQFDDTAFAPLKRNQKVKIKGRFLGYDDLLDELSINECTILD